jgi:hypothetical protein
MFRRRATWYTAALIVLTGVVLALEGGRYGAEYMSVAPRRRRLKIVMFSTPNIVDQYAGLAAEINELYARRHGYEFEHVVEDVTPVGDRTEMMWRCVDVINDAMRDVTVDGVFYIDSDAVFQDHSQPLDWLFDIPDGHIVGSSDKPNGPYYINAGVVFVRNSSRGRALATAWRAMKNDRKYHRFAYEQQALHDLARREGYRGIVSLPAETMNSIKAHLDQGRRDTFILHMMGASSEQRAAEFRALRAKLVS